MTRTEWKQLSYALAWGLVALVTACAAALWATKPARSHDHITDPGLKSWVQGLKNSKGEGCCDTADGYPAEAEWDTQANSYRVRIEGKWYVVPDEAVLKTPNRIGYAMVWWFRKWEGGVSFPQIRCFIAGGGV